MTDAADQRPRRLLSIGTDRSIFEEGSAVRLRQIEYAKKWDEVHIVVFAGRDFTEQQISADCFIYPTRSGSKPLYPLGAMKLGRSIIRSRGITDITCQDASFTAMAGAYLAKRFGLPFEIQVHEDIGSPRYAFNMKNRIRKALAARYVRRADTIRVVSERIKRYLVGALGVEERKITVRPIVVDTGLIRAAPVIPSADLRKKYPQFQKIVLMASRLEPEKNILLAIASWPEVMKRFPGAGLVIVGRGSERPELEAAVSRSDLALAIVFEDWADKATLYSYYKTADLFLNTSIFEGYGMALVEALAAGCKAVSTDVGAARESGAIMTEPDPQDVAKTLIRAL
ncbi:MAG: glycosyltransferase family 4 protein [Minisyncoccia bacterium]|jgi:glycosyltransferase involved in cell wall biosynthesis